ncbi:MAG: hypothetical protein LBF34_01090 [Puniceicoccales bacterium]|jgi:hypothetical protein|nr:hypothetical protein [Puniceicoccales bacterium]
MLQQRYITGIALLFFTSWEVTSVWAYGERRNRRVHSSSTKRAEERDDSWIKEVVIAPKENHDFEYFSAIWRSFCGEPFRLNGIGNNREQRYVLGIDSERDFAGTYMVILLNDSLKNFMGQGMLTVEYVVCNELDPRCVTFSLPEKNVVDDRQILLRLDPSRKFRKKIVAWRVTIKNKGKECVQSSLFWKKLNFP